MDKKRRLEIIVREKLLFIIRTESIDSALKCFDILADSGARVIEFTSTIPDYQLAIKKAKRMTEGSEILVGAGTVLDKELALKAIEGLPDFVVNPTQNFEILEVIPKDIVVFMGGFTPTEIIQNHRKGVDFVKIFPASVLGPRFIQSLKKGPLPFVKVLASGGMDADSIGEYLLAGADVIGVGSEVVRKEFVKNGEFHKIQQLAKIYFEKLQLATNGK
ncbi:MAG: hypothetical protein ABDH28_00340 [Brevinematia bacterium]